MNKFKRNMMIALAVAALWVAQIACEDTPTGNPITAPVTQIEQTIINAVDTDCSDNALSGC